MTTKFTFKSPGVSIFFLILAIIGFILMVAGIYLIIANGGSYHPEMPIGQDRTPPDTAEQSKGGIFFIVGISTGIGSLISKAFFDMLAAIIFWQRELFVVLSAKTETEKK